MTDGLIWRLPVWVGRISVSLQVRHSWQKIALDLRIFPNENRGCKAEKAWCKSSCCFHEVQCLMCGLTSTVLEILTGPPCRRQGFAWATFPLLWQWSLIFSRFSPKILLFLEVKDNFIKTSLQASFRAMNYCLAFLHLSPPFCITLWQNGKCWLGLHTFKLEKVFPWRFILPSTLTYKLKGISLCMQRRYQLLSPGLASGTIQQAASMGFIPANSSLMSLFYTLEVLSTQTSPFTTSPRSMLTVGMVNFRFA